MSDQMRPCFLRSSYVLRLYTLPSSSSNSSIVSCSKISCLPSRFNRSATACTHEHTQCGTAQNAVRYVQVMASSIFVISWKCFVFGKPRARIPNACLDSWKCRSKFFLSNIHINRRNDTYITMKMLTCPYIHGPSRSHIGILLPVHGAYITNRGLAFRPNPWAVSAGCKFVPLPLPLLLRHRGQLS
jgi:hypothetical protein